MQVMHLKFSKPVFEIPVSRRQMSTAGVKRELGQEQTVRDCKAMK